MVYYLIDPYLDIVLICGIPLILVIFWGVWEWIRQQEKRISELEEKLKKDEKERG